MSNVSYECPKCGGTDVYMRKQRELKGVGGIYGNRQKTGRAAFCRSCDIEAEEMVTKRNGETVSAYEENKKGMRNVARVFIVISSAALIFASFGLYLAWS